jgi:hypothetical protein
MQTDSQELIEEVSKWTMGLGILVLALAPLSIPILVLTAVALLPLLVPLVALALIAGVAVGTRGLVRRIRGRERRERSERAEAAGHTVGANPV